MRNLIFIIFAIQGLMESSCALNLLQKSALFDRVLHEKHAV